MAFGNAACRRDRDPVAVDLHRAVPSIAQRDAANRREIEAVVKLALVIESVRGLRIEYMQRVEGA